MKNINEFAVTVGWDWADKKHDLWLRPTDGSKAQHVILAQSPEALHEWVAKLRERFAGRPRGDRTGNLSRSSHLGTAEL